MPIVRFRLRKLAPFEVDDAAVSYQVMRQEQGQMRVLVMVMPSDVRAEYEGVVRAAGYEPGVLLPSMLASLAALRAGAAALVVNRNGLSLTTAIANGDELLLHRTMELPESAAAQREDLAQAVSVASAYPKTPCMWLPTFFTMPAREARRHFSRYSAQRRKTGCEWCATLRPRPEPEAANAVPKGLAAGVTGALAS